MLTFCTIYFRKRKRKKRASIELPIMDLDLRKNSRVAKSICSNKHYKQTIYKHIIFYGFPQECEIISHMKYIYDIIIDSQLG